MLTGNDVQLLYNLLDSLSGSLRDLAVKYELLVATVTRQENEILKNDAVISNMAREMSLSFASISKAFDRIEALLSEGKVNNQKVIGLIESTTKAVDATDAKVDKMMRDVMATKSETEAIKSVTLHVDSHMDGFVDKLSSIDESSKTASQAVVKMGEGIETMNKQLEPIQKVGYVLSKPVAIIVSIYFLVTTIVTIRETIQQVKEIKNNFGASTNQVEFVEPE